MAASVTQSRFALLKVEDDEDSDEIETKTSKQNCMPAQQPNNIKKKNKKKKKGDSAFVESAELKHLAFGKTNRQHSLSGSSDGHSSGKPGKNATEQQWEEWKKMDEEFTAEHYEKELQQALIMSKLEFEAQEKERPPTLSGAGGDTGKNVVVDLGKESKKKKKKDKPNTMSLEQFNQAGQEATPQKTFADELEDVPTPVTVLPKPVTTEVEAKFFDKVDDDVNRILRKEKMQEEYKKQYAVENVISAKYQEEVTKKDKEIKFLRATMKKQEEELQQVKTRNKQLCHMLGHGEMKDKAEVLEQVDQLSLVKDELTEQVLELTAELEKERSKVHTLKSELDKLKGGKHGK